MRPPRDAQRPLRVLHVITGLFTGGAETMLERLVRGSDPQRLQHAVVSLLSRGPVGERLEEAGVWVRYLGIKWRLPFPHQVGRLRRAVRDWQPDVVQGWMVHGNLAALVAAQAIGAPTAWHVVQSLYDVQLERLTTRLLLQLTARLSRKPACIIYNARTTVAQHEALGYDPRGALVIPSGFDLKRFRPDPSARRDVRRELGIHETIPLVGMVARFHPQKDHATFVAAAGRLVRAGSTASFVLAGRDVDENNPALVRARREAGLEGRLLLLGEWADPERLFAALDIAALSSAFGEAFPNVLGEAMACAVPCVTTDVADSSWIVGDTGRVAPTGNPEAFAAAIAEVLEMPETERRALGARARARIEVEFPLDAIWKRYLEVYETVAAVR